MSLAGNYNESIIHYEIAIKINPQNADAHNNIGASLNDLEEFEKAIKHLNIAIKINPDFANAYHNLSISLNALK